MAFVTIGGGGGNFSSVGFGSSAGNAGGVNTAGSAGKFYTMGCQGSCGDPANFNDTVFGGDCQGGCCGFNCSG